MNEKQFTEKKLQKVIYSNPEKLANRLKEWIKNPQSQPEIEYYFKHYQSKGKVLPRPKTQTEKDLEKYVPMINIALALEKEKQPEKALSIYLMILDRYEPIGTAFYERPAIILEKQKRYLEAIDICKKALANKNLEKSWPEFQKRLARLEKKAQKEVSQP